MVHKGFDTMKIDENLMMKLKKRNASISGN